MPTAVRFAVVSMSLLAGFLLVLSLLAWANRAAVVEATAHPPTVSHAQAVTIVFWELLICLVLGLLFAVSAWFLPRRRAWARWTGLAAAGVVTLIVLYGAIVSRGLSPFSLLVLVLALTAATTLVSRTTSTWAPRKRAVR